LLNDIIIFSGAKALPQEKSPPFEKGFEAKVRGELKA
jgi:hypothetical protein